MTISYNWLSDYLPLKIEVERLSKILTSVGLEVEHIEKYESVKGGLRGLVIGEVVECGPHPNADKLRLTRVNVGGEPLQIQRTNLEAAWPLDVVRFQLSGVMDALYAPKRRRVNRLTRG